MCQQYSIFQAIRPSPTGEARWGLNWRCNVTPLTIISPLSFSPVGEMQVTPVLSKLPIPVTPNQISH